jgi:hypothetical protein
LPRYTEEQFIQVAIKILPKISENLARYIGANVYRNQGDIRDVISTGRLLRRDDGPQEAAATLNTLMKYGLDVEVERKYSS